MERFIRTVEVTAEVVSIIAVRVVEAWVELSVFVAAVGVVARALGLDY